MTRERASNEAKSEFMSLMCHEVRTPLNGCLASAEMLLETPLQVLRGSSYLGIRDAHYFTLLVLWGCPNEAFAEALSEPP